MVEHLGIRNEDLGKNWGWLLIVGIAYVFLGIVTLSWPIASTVGLVFALGIVLVVNGIFQGIHSFQLKGESGNGWRVFQALAALAAGLLVLRYPGVGMEGIGITLAFYFFMGAAAKGSLAFNMRPLRGWVWMLLSGAASFLLGFYIIAKFPVAALWIPGFMLGLDLLVQGASLIGISFGLRNFHGQAVDTNTTSHSTRIPEARL